MVWNQIKTILLLGVLTAIMLTVGRLLGGTTGLTVALVIAIVMNAITYFWSDKIVLFMYGAKEAKKTDFPELHKIVEEVAHAAHIPKPKIYIAPIQTPNAFATGRNPSHAAIACTQGILQLLTKEELKGVIGHEIGHVTNRDILVTTVAATIAAVISYVANMAQFAALFGGMRNDRENSGGSIFGMLALAILAPIAALIIQLAISRSREYGADEASARVVKNPEALARALEKLESGIHQHPMQQSASIAATSSLFIANPFNATALLSLFSTHPPIAERARRLRAMKI